MKKVFICLVLISLFLITSQSPAIAHPPSKITTSYDPEGKTLLVVVDHKVADPKKHFIWKVDVIKNGNIVDTKQFEEQTDNYTQKTAFVLTESQPTDVIEIEAFCNISGKLKQKAVMR